MAHVMSLEHFDNDLLAWAIFEESNRVRAAHGLRAVEHRADLDAAADEQAVYTALSLSAGHSNPITGERNVAERVAGQGFDARRVGENAIMMPAQRPADAPERDYTYASYAAFLLAGWMNSPEHRDILLSHEFTRLGCAARLAHGVRSSELSIFAIQVFARP